MNNLAHYKAIRDQIQIGDVLCVKGRGFVSWRIKRITGGPYSHIGKLFPWQVGSVKRIMLFQSVFPQGVQPTALSSYLKTLNGEADILMLNHAKLKIDYPLYRSKLFEYGMDHIGKAYDTHGALSFRLPWIKEEKDKLICSEYAAKMSRHAGYYPYTFVHPSKYAADLYQLELVLKRVAVVK